MLKLDGEVGMANAASGNSHQNLSRTRLADFAIDDLERLVRCAGDRSSDLHWSSYRFLLPGWIRYSADTGSPTRFQLFPSKVAMRNVLNGA